MRKLRVFQILGCRVTAKPTLLLLLKGCQSRQLLLRRSHLWLVRRPHQRQGHELYMLEVNQFAKGTIVKWSRFVSRLRSRALWHVHGVLLWLLQRPALRYVPFPYPSVGTVSQWKMQAEQMVSLRCLPQRHVDRALRNGSFTIKNLADAAWLQPARGRNAGSKSQQGTCVKDEARSHGRGSEAGGPGNRRGQTGRGCKMVLAVVFLHFEQTFFVWPPCSGCPSRRRRRSSRSSRRADQWWAL